MSAGQKDQHENHDKSQEQLVGSQFGARASVYLTSAVHAQGDDLKAMATLVRGHKNARLLDLGCGAGHVAFTVAPEVGEVIAYDLSVDMLGVVAHAAAERRLTNIRTELGVVEHLPFPDMSFDFVMSRYSAHHWRDLDAGLREAHRVLKRGGTLAIIDSMSPGLPVLDTYLQAVEVLRDTSHVRSYSRVDWLAAIVRAGLMPTSAGQHRVQLKFDNWTERMKTPQLQRDAIRALQEAMSDHVRRHYAIGPDGSFELDVLSVQATRPAE
jgi:ubiquinone/menaquinone biosynthesis C-methylase UbiE